MDNMEIIFDVVGRVLPAVGVEFLLIGGHAVNHYGYSRATIDVDFMIASSHVDAVRTAMKLFALKQGAGKREEKDFPDIVNLVIEHGLDLEAELKPLCEKYADQEIYSRLARKIREERHA